MTTNMNYPFYGGSNWTQPDYSGYFANGTQNGWMNYLNTRMQGMGMPGVMPISNYQYDPNAWRGGGGALQPNRTDYYSTGGAQANTGGAGAASSGSAASSGTSTAAAPTSGGATTTQGAVGGGSAQGAASGGLLGGTNPNAGIPGAYTGTTGLAENYMGNASVGRGSMSPYALNDPYAANNAQPAWGGMMNAAENSAENAQPTVYEQTAFSRIYGVPAEQFTWTRSQTDPQGWVVANGQQSINFNLFRPANTGTGAYQDSWWVDSNWNNGLGRDLVLGQAGMLQMPASYDLDRPAGHQYYNGPWIGHNAMDTVR